MIRFSLAFILALGSGVVAAQEAPPSPPPGPDSEPTEALEPAAPAPAPAPAPAAARPLEQAESSEPAGTPRVEGAEVEGPQPLGEPHTGETLDTRYPNKAYIDAVFERSTHASLGYAVGRHGDGFIFALRYDQPVTDSFFLRFNQHTNFGNFRGDMDPVLALGVDTVMRSKLIFGLFRLYGGGGFWVGYRPSPSCANPLSQRDADEATARAIANQYARASQDQDGNTRTVNLTEDIDQAAVAQSVKEDLARVSQRCEDQKDNFTITGGGYSGIEFFSGPMRGFFLEVGGGGGAQKNGNWWDSGLIIRAGNQFYF